MMPLGDGLGDRYAMVDEALIGRLCDYAGVSAEDAVLEVGAGSGNLTEALLERGCRVVAVEKERSCVDYLREAFGKYPNFTLVFGDALRVALPEYSKVVSNLPYGISRKIVLRLLEEGFEVAVFVCQREFAEKLSAKPSAPSYRFVSAVVQSFMQVEVLEAVSPSSFVPRPPVSSAVVRLKSCGGWDGVYVDFLKDLFNHRNKKVRNILGDGVLFGGSRPNELSVSDLRRLFSSL